MSTSQGRVATITRRIGAVALGMCLVTAGSAAAAPQEDEGALAPAAILRAVEEAAEESTEEGLEGVESGEASLEAPVVTAPATAGTSSPVTITWTEASGLDVWFYAVVLDGRTVRYLQADELSVSLSLLPGDAEVVVVAVGFDYDDNGDAEVVWTESDPVRITVSGPLLQVFTDVPTAHPFYEEIFRFAQAGITTGYEDGSFRPAAPVKRASMAAFLYRFAGGHVDGFEVPEEPTFRDVPASHPFFEEIEWLVWTGVAEGYDDGTYKPERRISRQAMAAFLWRLAAGYYGDDAAWEYEPSHPPYVDVDWDHPFMLEIAWLSDTGMATGYPDGTYRPTRGLSRQAMAAFLVRAGE